MPASLAQKMAIIAALCALSAGCAAEIPPQGTGQSDSRQLRYYGGPKSPMWANQ
jgi:hypothetical protein